MAAAAAVAAKITAVWKHNFQQEIFRLDVVLFRFPVVSFDTEFPGFFQNTPRDAIDLTRYKDLRHNVDPSRLIQFGITVADARGNIGGTWEFNLRFDLSKDLFVS
uniref:poly(A)-specific ribonuclease n=1 Tax=Populus alba TaxID=43335 RepID=A0A4U5Q0X0_POPAL|nr:probable CCR4-associated factor 1 homolog 1 [Populus alba]TKS03082.1 putative CCR4-associated factor 1-like protein 8 [Populus alba]